MLSLLRMNKTTSSFVALDIIPDPENDQVFIFKTINQVENDISDATDIQVVDIDEDELEIELDLDFGDYYDTYYDEYEEDYEDDEDENEIIQQLEAFDLTRCPGA